MRPTAIVGLLVAVSTFSTQATWQERGAAVVTGVVRDAGSGDPVPFASVQLSGVGVGSRGTTEPTDESGRFRLEAPAGSFVIYVTKPSFARAIFPGASGVGGGVLTLAPGEQIHVTIDMAKGAVITGRVVDEYGDPAAYQPIHVWGTVAGVTSGFPWGGPEYCGEYLTDARGLYRLFGFSAGEYVVHTGPHNSPESSAEWTRAGRVPVYFSNVTEPSLATTIVLRAGQLGSLA